MKKELCNSQICTTKEQSKILLALGLKPETADMVYHYTKSKVPALEWELQTKPPTLRGDFWTPQRIAKLTFPFHKHPDETPMTGEEVFDELWGKDIPAWSLSRLLVMLPSLIHVHGDYFMYLKLSANPTFWIIWYDDLVYKRYYEVINKSIYDAVIETIEWLIRNRYFNKDFLL